MPTLNFTVRLPEDLIRPTRHGAAARGQSLHAYVLAAIRAHVLHQARRPEGVAVRAELARRPLAEEPDV